MGFFDKIKGAVQAATGGAATVTIELSPSSALPGDAIEVKVVATSSGREVKSKGIFIDLRGQEMINIKKGEIQDHDKAVQLVHTTHESAVQIAPDFVLPAGGTMEFQGRVVIPSDARPTFDGRWGDHTWAARGRVEAFGNDPDSGFRPFRVGTRP
jgi:hypothetical protein